MKIKAAFLILFLFIGNLQAQDAVLFQSYSNPLLLNPAFTGGSQGPTLYSGYSNSGYTTFFRSLKFQTIATGIDLPIDKLSGGFGLTFTEDWGGLMRNRLGSLSYAQSIKLGNDLNLRGGLSAGFFQKTLDVSQLTFGDQIEPRRGVVYQTGAPEIKPRIIVPDLSSGILLSGSAFNLGMAVHHFNRPNESMTVGVVNIPARFTIHGNYIISAGDYKITPHVLLMQQSLHRNINTGVFLNRKNLTVGANYRISSRTVGFMAGINIKKFRFGYMVEFNPKPFTGISYRIHEVYLTAALPNKKERKKLRPVNLSFF
jgi:type IX secretion system PorP/SprF family membrane protein